MSGLGIIVCYRKCWGCMLGQCEPGWHTWADFEDVEAALSVGKPDPSDQVCGCPCASEPPRNDEPDPDESIDALPCEVCGEVGACGYDAEGRPLIHATEEDDDA